MTHDVEIIRNRKFFDPSTKKVTKKDVSYKFNINHASKDGVDTLKLHSINDKPGHMQMVPNEVYRDAAKKVKP